MITSGAWWRRWWVGSVTPDNGTEAGLNIAKPSASWRAAGSAEALQPGIRYAAYGWTRDDSWFTGHVEFTLERLSTLTPGQVFSQTFVEANQRHEDGVEPYSQFAAEACA
ncbi:hypothetical protein AB0L64_37605 [Kribbella sp. NPDC051936]|uniref:hypothetical protein n=1 Tax=Kribbella sp. NPDC051936 TaxID=3154946 RepID=UPI0034156A21